MNEQTNWDQHIVGGPNDMFPDAGRNPGYQFGLDGQNLGTWLDYHHNLLSETHSDTTASAPVRGGVIVAQGATPKWTQYALSVPAANVRNALAVDNTEVEPTWKTTLDATAPTTIAEGDAATAGTSLIYSHRDHKHGAPATWKSTAHNLLDGDRHGDTVAQTASRGSLVYGNATPKWDELVNPSAGAILTNDATDTAWDTMAWTVFTPSVSQQAGTWTVDNPGDITTARYRMIGSKTMVVAFVLIFTSLATAASTYLQITIPNGKTAAATFAQPINAVDNAVAKGGAVALISGTTIKCYVDAIGPLGGGASWQISVNNTSLYGTLTFEVT